jgi:hypothetical protein
MWVQSKKRAPSKAVILSFFAGGRGGELVEVVDFMAVLPRTWKMSCGLKVLIVWMLRERVLEGLGAAAKAVTVAWSIKVEKASVDTQIYLLHIVGPVGDLPC